MKKPIRISIDTITKQTVVNYSNIVKGDILQMTISMFQNSASLSLTGQTIRIILRKPDGYSIEKKNLTVASGNTLIVDFDVQATLAFGEVLGEIQLNDADGTSISNKFTYIVDSTLADDIVTKSMDKIETLQQIEGIIDDYNSNLGDLDAANILAKQNIDNLEDKITTGTTLDNTLKQDISTGNALDLVLKDDINKSNALDQILKQDISNGNNTNNNLLSSIANGNVVIAELANVNWTYIKSMINLLEVITNGMPITTENDVDITTENDVEITM